MGGKGSNMLRTLNAGRALKTLHQVLEHTSMVVTAATLKAVQQTAQPINDYNVLPTLLIHVDELLKELTQHKDIRHAYHRNLRHGLLERCTILQMPTPVRWQALQHVSSTLTEQHNISTPCSYSCLLQIRLLMHVYAPTVTTPLTSRRFYSHHPTTVTLLPLPTSSAPVFYSLKSVNGQIQSGRTNGIPHHV
jgi:hypothetical protein